MLMKNKNILEVSSQEGKKSLEFGIRIDTVGHIISITVKTTEKNTVTDAGGTVQHSQKSNQSTKLITQHDIG